MAHHNYWRVIRQQIRGGAKVISLGEVHGAAVNPKVIQIFATKLGIDILLIELEPKWAPALSFLRQNRDISFLKLLRKEPWILESGLVGKEHISFFKKYLSAGKLIVPIKIEREYWNESERATATYISKIMAHHPGKDAILVMGNLHVRKKHFRLHRKNMVPVGAQLKTVSIRIRYATGYFYNFRNMHMRDSIAESKIKNGVTGLIPSKSPYFDYDYIVRRTKPITLL